MISFNDAHRLTLEHIQPLSAETVALLTGEGRIVGRDLASKVDAPSLDVSLKDGYAVRAADIVEARLESPAYLTLVGNIVAGAEWQGFIHPGEAARILSGAPLPQGADAVVAEEFSQPASGSVNIVRYTEAGRNILRQGADIQVGQLIVSAGQRLFPTVIGLLAAAGYQDIPVIRRPRVAILATGDEVLAPGQPLIQGKLYASNLFTLAAWCQRLGFDVETFVLHDDEAAIRPVLTACLDANDAILTSGGAWKGERDLVVQILDALGWQKIYHRVRMGPGKAVGFGLYGKKPVFCLPGGPPSNHMAFIQLGLPGLQKLAGDLSPGLPQTPAIMAETVTGQLDWTQFIHGRLITGTQPAVFQPLKYQSRLQEMAYTEAIGKIPEGLDQIPAGSEVMVQKLIL